jgi:hypothetical protein
VIANSISVPFEINDEKSTRDAFSRFAFQQGYTIINSQDQYPDYTLKLPTGETVDVEAEYKASGFFGHDPTDADLIICWERDVPVMPLPTIELQRYITSPNSEPLWLFAGVFDPGTHIKAIEVGYDNDYCIRFRWFKRDGRNIRSSGTKKPELTGDQLLSLLDSLDDTIQHQLFVDNYRAGYDQLIEWYDDQSRSQLPYPEWQGRVIGTIDSPISDGPLVWRLDDGLELSVRDKNNGPVRRFNATADLPEAAFITLLGQLPIQVREAVFMNGDIKSLYNWAQYND